jgi:hypothetical protein
LDGGGEVRSRVIRTVISDTSHVRSWPIFGHNTIQLASIRQSPGTHEAASRRSAWGGAAALDAQKPGQTGRFDDLGHRVNRI